MTYKELIKKIQSELNESGEKLTVDGDLGAKTMAALEKYDIVDLSFSLNKDDAEKAPAPAPSAKPFWVTQLESRIGWTEFNHDKEIAKDWGLVGLPQYKTVIGTAHAWCGLACAVALHSGGISFPKGAAGAANWRGWGESCDYICGAFLPIRHAGGGAHITTFLYWVDQSKHIAACLGGNQGDSYKVSSYNLSGNSSGHDEVVTGPRWPTGYAKTGYVYKAGHSEAGGSTT